jgi:hypothetical protein
VVADDDGAAIIAGYLDVDGHVRTPARKR